VWQRKIEDTWGPRLRGRAAISMRLSRQTTLNGPMRTMDITIPGPLGACSKHHRLVHMLRFLHSIGWRQPPCRGLILGGRGREETLPRASKIERSQDRGILASERSRGADPASKTLNLVPLDFSDPMEDENREKRSRKLICRVVSNFQIERGWFQISSKGCRVELSRRS
jgi:hypothetical protein